MTLEGLSSVCAKLEPASSKNNEILEINVLQNFTSHAFVVQILIAVQGAFFPGRFRTYGYHIKMDISNWQSGS